MIKCNYKNCSIFIYRSTYITSGYLIVTSQFGCNKEWQIISLITVNTDVFLLHVSRILT